MASSHLPQYRKFEGYLFKDTIDICVGFNRKYKNGAGLYEKDGLQFNRGITLHCYQQKRSVSSTYQLLGTEFENTITVVIRHNSSVYKQLFNRFSFGAMQTDTNQQALATFKGNYYRIINVSQDDSHYGSYDYLTLQAINGVKSNG